MKYDLYCHIIIISFLTNMGLLLLIFRPKENGYESSHESLPPAKRPHTMSPGGSSRISPSTPFNIHSGPIRLEDISLSREMRERERIERERMERERYSRESRERHDSYGSNYSEYTKILLHWLILVFFDLVQVIIINSVSILNLDYCDPFKNDVYLNE